MQVSIEDKSTVKKVIHIEISEKQVSKELNDAYKELKKTVDIKGFRKGKAPRKVLEARFSKDVHADITPRLIQNAFVDVVEEHKLDLAGAPRIEPPELVPGQAYAFDAEVEVRPEIEDVDFKGLDLKKTMYEVSEDEIDSQIQMVRKSLATKETVTEERPVAKDDFVLIDYQGFVDGQPFDKTPLVENYVMAIGGTVMHEEFSAKLTGALPGQKLEIEIAYGEDATDKELAGHTITYKVELKEIQEEVLPPEDDTLAEKLGEFENLEAVKAVIRDNLEQGYAQRIKHELSEQVFSALLEKNEFEVPDVLVDAELEGIVKEAKDAYTQNNVNLEDVGLGEDFLRTQYRHVAEKQAKRHLLLAKIIEQESLELTEEELEKGFEEMAVGMKATADAVKNFFNMQKDQLQYFKHNLLEKKAADIIIESGNITEITPEEAQAAQDAEAAKAVEAAAAAQEAVGEDAAGEDTEAVTETPADDTTA
ncbi:trigger factor [Desulfocicer vacuolatum DSM 3385]|uniref:Trigger factor n=1 Tax=Desulfocicer vacuolatum DSM 3385 TaxID=1121400 RepID=A0A1W2E4V4_9BACT|nr:trigger factor [Desulfocicer vacuolatum]SMD04735.1 trigger factor [Desulfocicer vacuolatum DSM 3385]